MSRKGDFKIWRKFNKKKYMLVNLAKPFKNKRRAKKSKKLWKSTLAHNTRIVKVKGGYNLYLRKKRGKRMFQEKKWRIKEKRIEKLREKRKRKEWPVKERRSFLPPYERR